MSDIIVSQNNKKRSAYAPKIDFTPMVDLGFLLITFFMFTTTLTQSKVMELNMPSTEHVDRPTVFVAESTITLIPVKGRRLIYYYGALTGENDIHRCEMQEVRNVLVAKQQSAAALPASFSKDAHKLHVLIKPNTDATYGDLVRLLDEMAILSIEYFAVTDISPEEQLFFRK